MSKIRKRRGNLLSEVRLRDYGFKKRAFTLAEVLITIGIIGIVSAITIPIFNMSMQNKVKFNRVNNIQAKLKQGMKMLMNNETLNGYESTNDFVKALSRHMKIISICSGNDIYKCWPSNTINVVGESEPIDVRQKLKNKDSFGLGDDYNDDIVGFITGDGVPFIISYKKDCNIDENDNRSYEASTQCIAGIFDWNGASSPNVVGFAVDSKGNYTVKNQDIYLLGGVTNVGNAEVSFFKFSSGRKIRGVAFQSAVGNNYDNWTNALNQCKAEGYDLPTRHELEELGNAMYDVRYNGTGCHIGNPTEAGLSLMTSIFPTASYSEGNGFTIFSKEEYSNSFGQYVYARRFSHNNPGYCSDFEEGIVKSGNNLNISLQYALCVE